MHRKVTQVDTSLFHIQEQRVRVILPRKEKVEGKNKASSSFQSIFQEALNTQNVHNT